MENSAELKRLTVLARRLQRIESQRDALLKERNGLWLGLCRTVPQRTIADASKVTESRLSQFLKGSKKHG